MKIVSAIILQDENMKYNVDNFVAYWVEVKV